MATARSETFCKQERITSKLVVDKLFQGNHPSVVVYPFRVVYMDVPRGDVPVSILISVPKKRFHNAVDRNRMKRLVREAYRRQKHLLWNKMTDTQGKALAFICISSQMCTYKTVFHSVHKALGKIAAANAQSTTTETDKSLQPRPSGHDNQHRQA